MTPGPFVSVARSAGHKLGNLQHAYYGEEQASGPDPMDQPRMQSTLPSDTLDNLSQPGKFEGRGGASLDEDVEINMERHQHQKVLQPFI